MSVVAPIGGSVAVMPCGKRSRATATSTSGAPQVMSVAITIRFCSASGPFSQRDASITRTIHSSA